VRVRAGFARVPGAAQHLHSASKTRVNALMVWCAADPGPFQPPSPERPAKTGVNALVSFVLHRIRDTLLLSLLDKFEDLVAQLRVGGVDRIGFRHVAVLGQSDRADAAALALAHGLLEQIELLHHGGRIELGG
jgi:hypothetical protein